MKRRAQVIAAGDLRHYCILQGKNLVEEDNIGGRRPDYTDLVTFWGNIEPIQGYETSNTDAQKLATTHYITTRFESLPDLVGTMRIKHTNERTNIVHFFAITGVVNKGGRDHKLIIQVTEQLGVN